MFGVLEAVTPGAGSDWSSAECIAVEEAEEEETEREIKDASPFARGETRAIDAIAPPAIHKTLETPNTTQPKNCKTLPQTANSTESQKFRTKKLETAKCSSTGRPPLFWNN